MSPEDRRARQRSIDESIANAVQDLDLRAQLLAAGQTVAYVDDLGRIVAEDPEGTITVLHEAKEWK